MYSGFAVIHPVAVLPFTCHHPPSTPVLERTGRVTPWATTPTTGAVVEGSVRKLTPSGAITVTACGKGVGVALGVLVGVR